MLQYILQPPFSQAASSYVLLHHLCPLLPCASQHGILLCLLLNMLAVNLCCLSRLGVWQRFHLMSQLRSAAASLSSPLCLHTTPSRPPSESSPSLPAPQPNIKPSPVSPSSPYSPQSHFTEFDEQQNSSPSPSPRPPISSSFWSTSHSSVHCIVESMPMVCKPRATVPARLEFVTNTGNPTYIYHTCQDMHSMIGRADAFEGTRIILYL